VLIFLRKEAAPHPVPSTIILSFSFFVFVVVATDADDVDWSFTLVVVVVVVGDDEPKSGSRKSDAPFSAKNNPYGRGFITLAIRACDIAAAAVAVLSFHDDDVVVVVVVEAVVVSASTSANGVSFRNVFAFDNGAGGTTKASTDNDATLERSSSSINVGCEIIL
jgi:hypothetical protein